MITITTGSYSLPNTFRSIPPSFLCDEEVKDEEEGEEEEEEKRNELST